jgi:hypothetical protein
VGTLIALGLGAIVVAAGVAAMASSGDSPVGAIWDRARVLGWGEVLAVAGVRAADALGTAVTSVWLLVVAGAVYAAADASPTLPASVRRLVAAAAVPGAVALVATDAGPAATGWLAVCVCTLVAASRPRPDLVPAAVPAAPGPASS